MMKRIGRSFISLLLVAILVVTSCVFAVSAASNVQSVTLNLAGVTGEDAALTVTGTVNNTPAYAVISTSYLSANGIQDEYGVSGIDGYVKVQFKGTGDAVFGASQEVGLNIDNGSFAYDMICNYIMEDGVFNYDDCTGCTIDRAAGTITIPAGETAVLSFTTPKSTSNMMYFTVLNFRAVDIYNEYDVFITNPGPGTFSFTNNYTGDEDVIDDAYSEFAYETYTTYGDGIDFTYDNGGDDAYTCYGFIDEENNFYSIDTTFRPAKTCELVPVILDADTPLFKVENKAFTDLQEANDAAVDTLTKRIILIKDGVLDGGDYTLSDGTTLLIPFDDANTLFTVKPGSVENAKITSRFPYRKLTMVNGASITVESGAAISVSAKHPSTTTGSGTQYNGAVAGGFGWIYMEEGTSITLNEDTNLYAWGYITGDGYITANNGATVYEFFQINDFRGGTITSRMADPENLNQFPLNQYYVQNIEAHLRVNHGAKENVLLELYAAGKTIPFICAFIDKDDADQCMFRLKTEGSYLEKYYDYTTDKMEYIMQGDADIDAITLSLSGVTISSADYYLPISNINVTIKEGSSLSTDKRVVFLPGSSVTVEEGAEILITTGEYTYINSDGQESTRVSTGSVIFASKDDIGKYSANGGTTTYPCKPVLYTPTAHAARTWATTEETFLDNNGSITVAEGASLASTSEKAEIYSSTGNGVFVLEGDNSTDVSLTSYQSFNESTNTVIGDPVVVEPAIIHDDVQGNDETDAHSTSMTWGIPATFKKVNGVWGDYRNVTWIDLDGSVKQTMNDLAYDAFLEMEQPEAQEKPADDFASYEFLAWVVDTVNGSEVTVIPSYKTIRANCTVTWIVDGALYGEPSSVEYGSVPDVPTQPRKDRDSQYTYTFAGWSSDGGVTLYKGNFPEVLDDITYTAYFTTTLRTYTIRFGLFDNTSNNGSGVVSKNNTAYGTAFTDLYNTLYPGKDLVQRLQELKNYTDDYAFIGWAVGTTSSGAISNARNRVIAFAPGVDITIEGETINTYYYAVMIKVEQEYFVKHSISLNGNIGVNFYIELPDGENADDYTIGYTFRNEIVEPVALAGFYDDETEKYKFTVGADAPQMTDAVTAVLYKNGSPVDSDVYKVVDYSKAVKDLDDNVITDDGYYVGDLKQLVREMLNYGAKAQAYFADKDYADAVNPVSAADSIDDPTLVNHPTVTDAQLAAAITGTSTELYADAPVDADLAPYGLKYYGTSAVLDSQTALRIYFSVTDPDLFDTYRDNITFGFRNEAVAPVNATESGRYVYVEYSNIAAAELDDVVTLKINGSPVIRYSVMDYLRKALNDAQNKVVPDTAMIDLVTAMYYYNQAADAFFV